MLFNIQTWFPYNVQIYLNRREYSMEISGAKEVRGRRYSGFNLLPEDTTKILKAISRGEFLLNGFDNKSIWQRLYNDSKSQKIIGKTTRPLVSLKAHGMIKKYRIKTDII